VTAATSAQVFISHSAEDAATAQALCEVLEAAGLRCWIAPRDIPPGETWMSCVMQAIADAGAMVLLFTRHSNVSVQVPREVERALNRQVPLIPFLIDKVEMTPALELLLATCQWYDATEPPLERHFERLAETLLQRIGVEKAVDGAASPTEELNVETAHVLFLDVVGYSKQSTEAQARISNALARLVQETEEYRRAQAGGELLTLPTGDGMALVFFRNPLSPVRCAVEIAGSTATSGGLPLRMGAHSGVVTRLTDAAGRENVSGDGINSAQRVMACGDANHILISGALADMLSRFEAWRGALTDLGEAEVKHGERIRIYNLLVEGAGNPEPPTALRPAAPQEKPKPAPSPQPAHASTPLSDRTVALLYKRNAPDSEHLLAVLEPRIRAAGYRVFVDRHLAVGVEWAQELKREVSEAYAIVPLLSAESIWSEMLESEVQTAHEASQARGGRPYLLPVRVRYEGPLSEILQQALGTLQYAMWRGPEDDEPLVETLLNSLRRPPGPVAPPKLDPTGGPVPLDSRYYVVRPTDGEFEAAMDRGESIALIKGARQMGKTSLLTRGLQRAKARGLTCMRTDYQKFTANDLKDEESFYLAFAGHIADQLDLDVLPEETWNARRGGSFNFERYLRKQVLDPSPVHVVWALDEVDKLFSCSFGSDVFALFRSWHNDRSYDPEGPWSKLTMAIAYATEAHLFITDVNQSPFNVGARITLQDFTPAETADLNERYGRPLQNADEVARFHALTGGQPFLSRRGFDRLVERSLTLETLEAEAALDEGAFGDHLRRLLVMVSQDAQTLQMVRDLLEGGELPEAVEFYRLRSGGLVAGTSERDCRLRCRLYDTYLRRHLL
jgi:class 3 adenylate cyclase